MTEGNTDSPTAFGKPSVVSPTTATNKTTVIVEPQSPTNVLSSPNSKDASQLDPLPVDTKEELVATACLDENTIEFENGVKASPLLSSTPPTVSKALIKSYPFLKLSHKVLSILTWTDDNINIPLFLVVFSTIGILYYDVLIIYAGHLFPVLILWVYSEAYAYVSKEEFKKATLDDIVQTMSQVAQKTEILISPIVSLNLTAGDLKRLLFTTIFLSPAYIVISLFILSPQKLLLIFIFSILTYHSQWSRVTRELLWKSRTIRLICFYITGLDFENQYTERPSLFHLNKRITAKLPTFNSGINKKANKNVRFTYVLYENQRRWLGVGWTPNLLSYERTPWTDEFLNEAPPLENFELPKLSNEAGMVWRWVDKTWRLDRTNDSAIQINSGKAKTTANPKNDEGWVYFDNTWKSPGLEDSFSKYTRRRRWVRTAELVKAGSANETVIEVNDSKVKFGGGSGSGDITHEESVSTTALPAEKENHSNVKFGANVTSGDDVSTIESVDTYETDEDHPHEKFEDAEKECSEKKVKKRKSIRFED